MSGGAKIFVMEESGDELKLDIDKEEQFSGCKMAPKNSEDHKTRIPEEGGGDYISLDQSEEDLEEIAAINESLDSLDTVLDAIEERTANIKTQLLALLSSNRSLRESFKMELEQEKDT